MSEKPKHLRAYFEAAKVRRKKEIMDRFMDIEGRISQAKNRKEYYTILELQAEYREVQKELEDLKGW
jgi:hypothetical protein